LIDGNRVCKLFSVLFNRPTFSKSIQMHQGPNSQPVGDFYILQFHNVTGACPSYRKRIIAVFMRTILCWLQRQLLYCSIKPRPHWRQIIVPVDKMSPTICRRGDNLTLAICRQCGRAIKELQHIPIHKNGTCAYSRTVWGWVSSTKACIKRTQN